MNINALSFDEKADYKGGFSQKKMLYFPEISLS